MFLIHGFSETEEYADGAHCGKTISITDSNSGTVATGVIADECPGCGAKNNIDLSQGLFDVFENEDVGVFPGTPPFFDIRYPLIAHACCNSCVAVCLTRVGA
jgi:hypothetical protein